MALDKKSDDVLTEDEELFEEDPEAKKRFDTTPDTTEVFLMPQCVECVHNGGLYECAVLGEKPQEYITNQTACPKRES